MVHLALSNMDPRLPEPGQSCGHREIIAVSAKMRELLRQVESVARTDASVLVCGETGTGKELIARMVHSRSHRASHAFVQMNCAAVPAGLFESELFGHERGAFTGAMARRTGRFELADGGTLLLDEVGEMPLELQPKLLRVLQEKEFERVGSTRTIACDVRLVAATHRDLQQMLADRTFREDLYYRLNVFPIVIPPLRDRRDDIGPLVRHLVPYLSGKLRKEPPRVAGRTLANFERYSWPGNIRELQNVLERAIILNEGPELDVELPDERRAGYAESAALDDVTRAHIEAVLAATKGVISGPSGAAAVLGIKRTTLHFRMKKLGIEHRHRESWRPS